MMKTTRTNLSLDPRELTAKRLTKEDAAKFLIAVGKTMLHHDVSPAAILGDISSLHYKTLSKFMQAEGIDGADVEDIYESASGNLFGEWP